MEDNWLTLTIQTLIADGDLVLPEELGFPSLPVVGHAAEAQLANRAIYGPEFGTRAIASVQQPVGQQPVHPGGIPAALSCGWR